MIHRWLHFWRLDRQIERYLRDVMEIVTNRRDGSLRMNSTVKIIFLKTTLISLVYTAKCLQFICLIAYISPADHFSRLINYDIMLFYPCDPKWNLYTLSVGCQVIHFLHRMYWKAWHDPRSTVPAQMHWQIVYRGDVSNYFVPKSMIGRKGRLVRLDSLVKRASMMTLVVCSNMIPIISKFWICCWIISGI